MTSPRRIDLRGHACPMTWVRTRIALERLATGDELEVWLAGGEPADSVPRTAAEEGHRVLSLAPLDGAGAGWCLVLRKGAAGAQPSLP